MLALVALVTTGLHAAPAAPATSASGSVQAQADHGDRPRLRAPDPSFLRPSTLYILGEGRRGTWSLVGSTLGAQPCTTPRGSRCVDLAVAQLVITWRPFGSWVSLFTGIGASSGAVVPNPASPVGFRLTAGLMIDLPPLVGWRMLRAAR